MTVTVTDKQNKIKGTWDKLNTKTGKRILPGCRFYAFEKRRINERIFDSPLSKSCVCLLYWAWGALQNPPCPTFPPGAAILKLSLLLCGSSLPASVQPHWRYFGPRGLIGYLLVSLVTWQMFWRVWRRIFCCCCCCCCCCFRAQELCEEGGGPGFSFPIRAIPVHRVSS